MVTFTIIELPNAIYQNSLS